MEIIIKAIILGIIEGITEFLPVSSTGHLIIFGHLLDFTGPFAVTFEIIIQLGAILAVVVYYRRKILNSLKNLKPGKWGFKLWLWMAIAFIPSGLLAFFFEDLISTKLFSPLTVSIALIVGAVMMLIVETVIKVRNKTDDIMETGPKKSFLIGCAQCMSLIPGMSRSASAIMGGMLVGLTIRAAAEFSFFLAIPTMFIASGYSILKGFGSMSAEEAMALAAGFAVSFAVAFFVVGKFITFLGKHRLRGFALYRLAAGAVMLALIWAKII